MTLTIPSRRRFLLGAGALLAAPSIVRAASLMPVSVMPVSVVEDDVFAQLQAMYLGPQMIALEDILRARDMLDRQSVPLEGRILWLWPEPPLHNP